MISPLAPHCSVRSASATHPRAGHLHSARALRTFALVHSRVFYAPHLDPPWARISAVCGARSAPASSASAERVTASRDAQLPADQLRQWSRRACFLTPQLFSSPGAARHFPVGHLQATGGPPATPCVALEHALAKFMCGSLQEVSSSSLSLYLLTAVSVLHAIRGPSTPMGRIPYRINSTMFELRSFSSGRSWHCSQLRER